MANKKISEEKTVQNVKNSLKFKANEKDGLLSVRVGVQKFTLPVTVRILNGGEYLFLSFAASSELYRVSGKDLIPLPKDDDASEAFEILNPGRRSRKRRGEGASLPDALAEALKGLPEGMKLGYSADGTPKLVRSRTRKKKA